MFAVCVITLCLMSVSHQVPLDCEDSVRPPDQLDRSDLEGRWVLIAGSLMDPADLESFKRRDSASSNFVNASEPSKMSFTGNFRFGDSCRYVRTNITLEGPSFTIDPYNLTATSLKTSCPDCAVMRFDNWSKELKRLYLFSRKRDVEMEAMEEFKAQVECLNMPPLVLMDPTKEICPDPLN